MGHVERTGRVEITKSWSADKKGRDSLEDIGLDNIKYILY
jgi:hypothetical protein